ncbi:hypothetical protein BDN67DRAFT_971495 [Paxillus ammoniavirescens]|nr:hypothetical protein BDN67DRAFT_971495 [Paxillus ammoniavirescens]
MLLKETQSSFPVDEPTTSEFPKYSSWFLQSASHSLGHALPNLAFWKLLLISVLLRYLPGVLDLI